MDIVRGIFQDYWQRIDDQLVGLIPNEVYWRPEPHSNSIGFIVWHLARVEDDWMTIFAQDTEDLWESRGWFRRFGLGRRDMGYRVSLEWVKSFPRLPLDLLAEYRHAVQDQTQSYFNTLEDPLHPASLDFVPGRTCVPEFPDTLEMFGEWSIGRMLRQVSSEINQHLGQVRYLRGMQRGMDG